MTLLSATSRASFGERNFKYLLIGPAIFVLLLIGIFPLVYLLLVSFQGITMTETSTDFIGGANYAQLFDDARLWEALLHTVIFTVVALPLELLLGLTMAQLFLEQATGPADFHRAAGPAGGGLADRLRSDVVAHVQPPLRADQPDHRLDLRARN